MSRLGEIVMDGLDKAGKLPIETKDYLDKAWLEIEDTACYQDYGSPRKGLT